MPPSPKQMAPPPLPYHVSTKWAGFIQSGVIISRHLVTLQLKSMYFQIFCQKKNCRKTIEDTIMKRVPNESKLIYAYFHKQTE